MKSNLNIPKEIVVGYQNREDTYSGRLGYVVYRKGAKGEIAKKASWEHWRDKNIDAGIFENTPTLGFFLNRMIGGRGGGWDSRRSMCRIYDPRGFEFEITAENLLFILQHSVCNLGELKGEFVYSWDGKDLVLLPCNCQDYIDSVNTINRTVKILPSALEVSAGYKTRQGDLYYLGKFPWYSIDSSSGTRKCKGNYYTFVDPAASMIRGYANPTSRIYHKIESRLSQENTEALIRIFTEETYYGAPDEKLLGIVPRKSEGIIDKDDLLMSINNFLTTGTGIPAKYHRIFLMRIVSEFKEITQDFYELRRVNGNNETEGVFRTRRELDFMNLGWKERRERVDIEVKNDFIVNSTLKYINNRFDMRSYSFEDTTKSIKYTSVHENSGRVVPWDNLIGDIKNDKIIIHHDSYTGVNILLESGKVVREGYFNREPSVLCKDIITLLGTE